MRSSNHKHSTSKTKPISGFTPHQERVYGEMYRALETLGRRLEQSETARDTLAARVYTLESQMEENIQRNHFAISTSPQTMPKWVAASSMISMFIAVFALGLVLVQPPHLETSIAQRSLSGEYGDFAARYAPRFDVRQGGQTVLTTSKQENYEDPVSTGPAGASTSPLIGSILDTAAERQPAGVSKEALPKITMSDDVKEDLDESRYVALNENIPARDSAQVSDIDLGLVQSLDEIMPAAGGMAVPDAQKAKEAPRHDIQKKNAPDVEIIPSNVKNAFALDETLSGDNEILQQQAVSGNAEAAHDLGALYASGEGIARDYQRAYYWFEKAAVKGIANAAYNLGVMNYQGLGRDRDIKTAIKWYEQAAENSHP